jgi:hypothetical protein
MKISCNNYNNLTIIAIVAALALFGAAIVTIPLQQQQQAYAQAETFTNSERIPVDFEDFVPCAAGGEGEVVHLTGILHALIHLTLDSTGGVHAKLHDNPQGISGTGLTTGDKYQATGAANIEINSQVGIEFTFVSNFHIIGQGNGNNFLLHRTFHITVNPDGTVTAFVDNFRVECK